MKSLQIITMLAGIGVAAFTVVWLFCMASCYAGMAIWNSAEWVLAKYKECTACPHDVTADPDKPIDPHNDV